MAGAGCDGFGAGKLCSDYNVPHIATTVGVSTWDVTPALSICDLYTIEFSCSGAGDYVLTNTNGLQYDGVFDGVTITFTKVTEDINCVFPVTIIATIA